MNNIQKVTIAAAVALSLSVTAFGQAQFNVVAIKGSSASLTAINNSGQVLANVGTTTSYDVSVWSRSAGFQDLNLTGMNSGGAAIDAFGDVVGAGDPNNSGILQAFIWQPATGVQWLGSLGGGLSAASGVNDDGAVVGLSYTAATTQHAFLWTQAGGMQDLTPALTSIGGATAVAINSYDQVVGYYFPNGSRNTVGFTWTEQGGLQDLGPAGTLPLAINDEGTVVGQVPDAQGYKHAFSWTQSGGMTDLGTLGGVASSALGINNKGWIVGTSLQKAKNGILHAFLWTPSAGMQDLTTLAGIAKSLQPHSVQVNDFGVIAISTNAGLSILSPKMNATVASSANPSRLGQAVTFTVTVSSIAGPPPDGEIVQFSMGGRPLGSAQLINGIAQLTTSAIPVGPRVVTATYSGDANYLPSTYQALKQFVTP